MLALALGSAGCASRQPATNAPATPAETKPAKANTAAESASDYSSAAGFTRTGLDLLRQGEPKGGWVSPQLLKLTNANGLLVNLERVWSLCESDHTQCEPELKHLVQEVLKVATRPESPKATPERLFAVIRPIGYFDGAPPEVRAESLFEPLTGDLVVVYVMDEGGAVRGAKSSDLKDLSLSRGDVPAVARRNLNLELPVPPNQPDCRPHAVGVWRSGSYFESSRLLLSDYWQGMADRTHRTIIAAAPAADSLVVVCDPTAEELVKLRQMVEQLARQAARPVSNTLLKWTAAGWRALE
ncbi:MAG TPA: DUF1444 family protein [Polyangiaceae bacterium]|nr:DUF1444 family protein [Polyangiaceae bacterium]